MIDDKEKFTEKLGSMNQDLIRQEQNPINIDNVIYDYLQNFYNEYKDFFSKVGMRSGNEPGKAVQFIERSLNNMKSALADKKNSIFVSDANILLKYFFNMITQEKKLTPEETLKAREKLLVIAKLMYNVNIKIESELMQNALIESSSSIVFRK